MKAAKVNAGLAESNGKLLPGLWRKLLHVTCGLTACTPGSAPGPTLGNEYGKTLPFLLWCLVVVQSALCECFAQLLAHVSYLTSRLLQVFDEFAALCFGDFVARFSVSAFDDSTDASLPLDCCVSSAAVCYS